MRAYETTEGSNMNMYGGNMSNGSKYDENSEMINMDIMGVNISSPLGFIMENSEQMGVPITTSKMTADENAESYLPKRVSEMSLNKGPLMMPSGAIASGMLANGTFKPDSEEQELLVPRKVSDNIRKGGNGLIVIKSDTPYSDTIDNNSMYCGCN